MIYFRCELITSPQFEVVILAWWCGWLEIAATCVHEFMNCHLSICFPLFVWVVGVWSLGKRDWRFSKLSVSKDLLMLSSWVAQYFGCVTWVAATRKLSELLAQLIVWKCRPYWGFICSQVEDCERKHESRSTWMPYRFLSLYHKRQSFLTE